MKRVVTLYFLLSGLTLFAQNANDPFARMRQQFDDFKQSKQEEFEAFTAKQNEEFSAFMQEAWQLFENFQTQKLQLDKPKMADAPVAPGTEKPTENIVGAQITPPATQSTNSKGVYVLRTTVTPQGSIQTYTPSATGKNNGVVEPDGISFSFYGRTLFMPCSPNLRIRANGVSERHAADYFRAMAQKPRETRQLWHAVQQQAYDFGLNEWGHFCLLRSVAETLLTSSDECALFLFYMLRNEGGYKVKIARGQDSGKLTLLLALDNEKEVYSYTFFRFPENERQVKYYAVYGGGKAKESIYTYAFTQQETSLKQMRLDFDRTLNIGSCDQQRTLHVQKTGATIHLPYNSSHMAYLNDVPMTVFPIYFSSEVPGESQEALQRHFEPYARRYSQQQMVDLLLNFVQTAFAYRTDRQQFGYEKYFYPEEVIGYPYSDCEDRSALFSWLVTSLTGLQVIGLQYEGHVATAVAFTDPNAGKGDYFSYGGRRYYVCDPTYINASIGMTMPQFKGKTPKVIRLKTISHTL